MHAYGTRLYLTKPLTKLRSPERAMKEGITLRGITLRDRKCTSWIGGQTLVEDILVRTKKKKTHFGKAHSVKDVQWMDNIVWLPRGGKRN